MQRSSSVDISLDKNSHRNTSILPAKVGNGHIIVPKPSHSATSTTQLNNNDPTPIILKDTGSGSRKRPNLVVRTTTPLSRNNTSSTVNSAVKPSRFDPIRAFRSSFLGNGANNSSNWKGKQKADPEKLDMADEALRESKVAAKAREIREWMKGKSGSDIHRSFTAGARTRPTVGGVRDLFKSRSRPAPAPPSPEDRGPKAGQTYEIVEQRIVEDSAQRTVEISTWREQLPAQKKKTGNSEDQEDKISVYYISADEYPQEGEYASRAMCKVEWRVDSSGVPPGGMSYSQAGSGSQARSHGQRTHISKSSAQRKANSARETQLSGFIAPRKANGLREPINSRRHHSKMGSTLSANRITSPLPSITQEGTISLSTSENESSNGSPSTRKPPPRSGSKFVENITTISSPTPPPKSPVARRSHSQRGRRYESPHAEKDLPPTDQSVVPFVSSPVSSVPSPRSALAPFNATRDSGSTISSIKSEVTMQFEAILGSCEPSLVHIAPILRTLGIRRSEHLRAIGKLTPATRDREVRESAFRLGVTVMEWAILLDKIFTML